MDLVLDDDMIARIISAAITERSEWEQSLYKGLKLFDDEPPLSMVSLPDPETNKISVTYINKKLL